MNCESYGLIYLLQCQICNLQYVGKSKTAFNFWLNNHRKDSFIIFLQNTILARKPFQAFNHNFQRDAKFTLIGKIAKGAATEQLQLVLKK